MATSDDEKECRICRGDAEEDRPLFYPCKCSGSIKYTHEDCLIKWLAESGSAQCELCHHPFRFEPMYQPDTPQLLPTREFVFGIVSRVQRAMKTAARICLVFIVWLFLLPVGTCWTWYALFINSPTQLPLLVAARGISGLITDAFRGCVLSIGIVFVFLGVSSLREYVRHIPDDEPDHGFDGMHENVNHDPLLHAADERHDHGDDEDFPIALREGALAHRFPEELQNAERDGHHIHARDEFGPRGPYPDLHDYVEDPVLNNEIVAGLPLNVEEPPAVTEVDDLLRDTFDAMGQDDDDFEDEDEDANHDAERIELINEYGPLPEYNQLENLRYGNDEGPEGDEIDLNLNNEHQEPLDYEGMTGVVTYINEDASEDGNRLGDIHDFSGSDSESDGMFDYPDVDHHILDEDGVDHDPEENQNGEGGALFGLFELDPEEVPLEEVVGLRGQLRNLFDHAGTVLLSNALFLGIFTFIPLCIGRVTLRLLSFRSFPIPASLSGLGFVRVAESVTANVNMSDGAEILRTLPEEAAKFLSNKSESVILSALKGNSLGVVSRNQSLATNAVSLATAVVSELRSSFASLQLKGQEEPLVSYADNCLVVLLGYGVLSLGAIGYVIVNSLLRSRYPRFDSPMTRYIAGMLRYVATLVKILVLILFEFGIFPLGCGWWLDLCTLDLVGGTLESRISFCHMVPWLCTAGHWFLGIIFMVHISLFVSLLREVLRPELLWFLRNPDDPDFHPFRELVEKPLSRHARRMCLSVFIYVPLVVAIVFVPSQLCLWLMPQVFPLRFDDFSHSLIDVPFGNLLVVPLISLVHHTRPGVFLHKALKFWIDEVGNALGIVHLVAKMEEEDTRIDEDEDTDDEELDEDGAPIIRMPERANEEEDDDDDEYYGTSDSGSEEGDVGASEYELMRAEVKDVQLKGFIMLTLAWVTLVICECLVLTIPTVTGRGLLRLIGLPVHHDLHSYGAGFYVLLMSLEFSTQTRAFLRTVDTATLLRTALPRVTMAVKGAVVVLLWLGLVPLAAGVLLELTITVPLRVPYNETPYLYLHQDWALGLLIMKLWNKVVLAGRFNMEWRERVERAREGGVMGLGPNFPRTLQEVVLPVLGWTLVALSVPYAFAQGVLPLLGFSTFVCIVVYRFVYVGIAAGYCLQLAMRSIFGAMRGLHDSIRDDKYLIGKRLYNFSDQFPRNRNAIAQRR